MSGEPRIVLVAAERTPGGRARYVFSLAPGWRVTVVSGAAHPTPDDAQVILDECFPRWRLTYPRQP